MVVEGVDVRDKESGSSIRDSRVKTIVSRIKEVRENTYRVLLAKRCTVQLGLDQRRYFGC
jgi:hypothetical protein